MESPPAVRVTNGTHKGKTGILFSKTEYYTKIKLNDGTMIRCKNSFVEGLPEPTPESPEPLELPEIPESETEDDLLLQQMLLESLKEQAQKQEAKQQSAMIQKQNDEYEQSLKQDINEQETKEKLAKSLVFEEVSTEEMRRVRLLRFDLIR